MKITAIEEYGLRCMMQLALSDSDGPMTVASVAENEGISTEYAGKLLNLLRQAGLVDSVRGRNGGFVLAHTADEITLASVVRALSNDLFDSEYCERHTGGGEVCVHSTACALRPVWSTLSQMVNEILDSLSLMDLLRSERQLCRELQPRIDALPDRVEPESRFLHQVRMPESN